MNRRAFLATVAGAIAAPAVAKVAPRPLLGATYGSWKGGVVYSNYSNREVMTFYGLPGEHLGLKIGDTIRVRRPARFVPHEPDAPYERARPDEFDVYTITNHEALLKMRSGVGILRRERRDKADVPEPVRARP